MSLSIRDLQFAYQQTLVLDGIGFDAASGELLMILGANGAGKTTLFRCILGEQKRYKGRIEIDGVDARTLSARETAHRIAYIPQTHAMTFRYSVRDMVLMGTSHGLSPVASPHARELRIADDAMRRIGILSLADRSFDRLSGGEQQLTYIARALAQQTKILLMDEPTASLDYGNQMRVLSVIGGLKQDGYTVLLSTHNPQHALWFADRVLAMQNGRAIGFGTPKDTLTEPLFRTLYGTDVALVETERGTVILPPKPELTGMPEEKEIPS